MNGLRRRSLDGCAFCLSVTDCSCLLALIALTPNDHTVVSMKSYLFPFYKSQNEEFRDYNRLHLGGNNQSGEARKVEILLGIFFPSVLS